MHTLQGRNILSLMLTALMLTALLLAGCGSTPKPLTIRPETDLHHPDPGRRALAVQQVAAQGSRAYVPDLIELLDDRDESVRLLTHGALTELTGHESDYQAFAPRAARLEALDGWRAWYESSHQGKESQP